MKTILLFLLVSSSFANITQTYKGTARKKDGTIAYKESHKVTFDDKRNVLKSFSEYKKPDGTMLGTITSDYTKKLTSPEHTFKNFRDGSSHGVRLNGDNYILFMKEKNKPEETKTFSGKKFDKNALVVGSQGLHYYLVKNLNEVKKKDELALKFLIPGKLDYYSFYLTTEKESETTIDFKIRIDNFFLNLFAPSLEMKYDKKNGNLLTYSGLSNIPDEDGEMQNVSIIYDYK
jgi:hypothetical protein